MDDPKKHAAHLRWLIEHCSDEDEAALLAGAEALKHKGTCAHCDERDGGFEDTIWCQECLYWWQDKSKDDAIAQLQEALAAADKTKQGRWRLLRHFGQSYLIPFERSKEWIDWCKNREIGEYTSAVPEWAKPVPDGLIITGVELP